MDASPGREARPSAPRRVRAALLAAAGALCVVVCAAIAIAIVVPVRPAPGQPTAAAGRHGEPSRDAVRAFERFALNLLLVPLVDDATPPRWQALGIDWVCGGAGDVTVDGRPLVDGAPLPRAPFRLRWTLHHCPPLSDSSLLVDGTVVLTVSVDDHELRALVEPRLRAVDGDDEQTIDRPFTAVQRLHPAGVR